jgi:transcriptional regulator GlxA family with amidase domain
VHARWVEDRQVLTSAGVSAGIDLALHLTSQLAGQVVAGQVQRMLEYEPDPPRLGPPDWSNVDVTAARADFRRTISETLDHAPALRDRLLAVAG